MLVYLARRSHVLSLKFYPYKKGGWFFFFFLVNDSNIYFRPWNRKGTSLLLFKIKIHKWIANSTVQERIWKAGWRTFRKPSRPQNTYHGELIYDCKYLVDQTVSGLFIDWLILINSFTHISEEMSICFLKWKMEPQKPFSRKTTTGYLLRTVRLQ